jgi:UDP-glucose 4-epimerase
VPERHSVLVTGAAGYIGRQLVARLGTATELATIVAADVRAAPPGIAARVQWARCDVRDAGLHQLMARHAIDTVVHLASIVTPPPGMGRDEMYAIDVRGTQNVVEACLAAGVRKLIVTSSGAAYGYHADNPDWLVETDPLRGNEEFAYSHHKRLVEEMLERYRRTHPQLRQLIFRLCTVFGSGVHNQISALFEGRFVLGVSGSATPFVFIWDADVVDCLYRGIVTDGSGIYNVAGDGTLTMRELAQRAGKPYVALPAWLLRAALSTLRALRLSPYGPEQVNFLRYRPVLSNRALKESFGFVPRRTSAEAFAHYLEGHEKRA